MSDFMAAAITESDASNSPLIFITVQCKTQPQQTNIILFLKGLSQMDNRIPFLTGLSQLQIIFLVKYNTGCVIK